MNIIWETKPPLRMQLNIENRNAGCPRCLSNATKDLKFSFFDCCHKLIRSLNIFFYIWHSIEIKICWYYQISLLETFPNVEKFTFYFLACKRKTSLKFLFGWTFCISGNAVNFLAMSMKFEIQTLFQLSWVRSVVKHYW